MVVKRKKVPSLKKRFPPRKKVCLFCKRKIETIDYKESTFLKSFLSERNKILPAKRTGTCGRHQRKLAQAIKRARLLALLPFVSE
jgi:small subunit ribosomal protein S18